MNIRIIVVGDLDTNCYILEKDNKCLIIDPGADYELIKKNIRYDVVGILLTHNHFDHIGALNDIISNYNVKVYSVNNLKEGINNINGFEFCVVYNFGHTMDSISFIFNDIMFCGDFIFKGCIGRCDLGGDILLMRKSIKNIITSKINYKIYPGHGDSTYLFDELDMLNYYIKKLR